MDEYQRRLGIDDSPAEIIDGLKTIKARVEFICKKYPACKGNYNLLTTRYFWYFYGRSFGIPFKELLELPSSESITRAFRKLVETGVVEVTGKTQAKRDYRESVMREFNGKW